MAPQTLKDVATLILDAGLRIGEARAVQWPDIQLEPASRAQSGYLDVREAQSRITRRKVPLTARVRSMLESGMANSEGLSVFAECAARPMLNSSLDHPHREQREVLKMTGEFVLHSLRNTYGTRLGEACADAFTIIRLMGHSSVIVNRRYVHSTPEGLERAVERLEGLNQKATKTLAEGGIKHLPTTVFATLPEPPSVIH